MSIGIKTDSFVNKLSTKDQEFLASLAVKNSIFKGWTMEADGSDGEGAGEGDSSGKPAGEGESSETAAAEAKAAEEKATADAKAAEEAKNAGKAPKTYTEEEVQKMIQDRLANKSKELDSRTTEVTELTTKLTAAETKASTMELMSEKMKVIYEAFSAEENNGLDLIDSVKGDTVDEFKANVQKVLSNSKTARDPMFSGKEYPNTKDLKSKTFYDKMANKS